MRCPECEAKLLPGVTFCRCGWPEPKDEFMVCGIHGTRYDPRSLCRPCAESDGIR